MPKKISFIIPMIHSYPEIYATVNDLLSYCAHDFPYDWEIIVVENGTVDPNTPKAFTGPRALYRHMIRRGRIRYTFEARQCGPVARNHGARIAAGDYIMLLDAHTTTGKRSIEPLIEYMEDHPECGCISGLTGYSHYDLPHLGSYYLLFPDGTAPRLDTHMHGRYTRHRNVPPEPGNKYRMMPFEVVMGSQAYTVYRRRDYWHVGGNLEEARFYPHPEGLMPLKMWMTGRTVVVHPLSYHLHGLYPRRYSLNPAETAQKIKEYGGWSWHQHFERNVFMVALTLGGEKWLDICYQAHLKHPKWRTPQKILRALRESAIQKVEEMGTRDHLLKIAEKTLDEVLTEARRRRMPGMEKWPSKYLGRDPLG